MSISKEIRATITCVLIGLAIAAIVGMAATLLTGCTMGEDLQRAVAAYRVDNPTAGVVPVDLDGDGMPEFLGADKDHDGKVDKDADGKLIEVPGTRAALTQAEVIDTGIGEILTLAAAVVGVPGVGIVGGWWAKRKPVKQLTTLIRSFEAAKEDHAPEGYITLSKDVLRTIQAERPELEKLIDEIRASVEKPTKS